MKSSTIYIIGIIVVILLGGYFFLGNSGQVSGVKPSAGNSGENAQEIVIGMKNYNYYPNTIKVKAGIPVRIRLDSTVVGCFRDFTIREFGIHKYLKTPEESIDFTPTKPGTYTFACSMGMGTGRLIVE